MTPRVRTWLLRLLAALVLLPVLVIAAGQLGAFGGTTPTDLGMKNGRLKAPSATPNSVTSQAALWPDNPQATRAAIEPLRYRGDGPAALRTLAALLRGMERTTLVTEQPSYLYAQARTRLLRFTDDVEFSLDEAAGVIHVRSASRHGLRRPRREPGAGGGHPKRVHGKPRRVAVRRWSGPIALSN
jgi:uncharacterized protein (DUF1499 family)